MSSLLRVSTQAELPHTTLRDVRPVADLEGYPTLCSTLGPPRQSWELAGPVGNCLAFSSCSDNAPSSGQWDFYLFSTLASLHVRLWGVLGHSSSGRQLCSLHMGEERQPWPTFQPLHHKGGLRPHSRQGLEIRGLDDENLNKNSKCPKSPGLSFVLLFILFPLEWSLKERVSGLSFREGRRKYNLWVCCNVLLILKNM